VSPLQAFEAYVRKHPTMGLAPEVFLRKLDERDPETPEFLDREVESEWRTFRAGFLAAHTLMGE
jgi:hypothetical protein